MKIEKISKMSSYNQRLKQHLKLSAVSFINPKFVHSKVKSNQFISSSTRVNSVDKMFRKESRLSSSSKKKTQRTPSNKSNK